jgi:hypothetical protein
VIVVSDDDVRKLLAHVAAEIGEPSAWAKWPGGWPGDIEAALVDAVFSARAVYRSKRNRGVYARVVAWRDSRRRVTFSLEALLAEIDDAGIPNWARDFGNEQWSPRRPATAPGGRLKAATVRQAASALLAENISVDRDITLENVGAVKRTLRTVPGVGYATVNYFLMLLGAPGVKPDTMVRRFLNDAAGHEFSVAQADRTVTYAADQLNVQPHELDHAIWCRESKRARQVRHKVRPRRRASTKGSTGP